MSDLQDVTVSELLQVGCPRKQTWAWRFAFRKCIRECSQGQPPGNPQGSRTGQEEKVGYDTVSTKASVNPMGNLEQGQPCRVFWNWDGGVNLYVMQIVPEKGL